VKISKANIAKHKRGLPPENFLVKRSRGRPKGSRNTRKKADEYNEMSFAKTIPEKSKSEETVKTVSKR
jgi:hypothetical protein